jgi:chemotaxis protein MotB
MNLPRLALLSLPCLLAGCVSEETYLKSQTELDKTRKALSQQSASLERQKTQIDKDRQALTAEREGLVKDKNQVSQDLSAALAAVGRTQQDLEKTRAEFDDERDKRRALESEIAKLHNARELRDVNEALRRDRDLLQVRLQDLERLLQSSQQVITTEKQALEDSHRRVDALGKEIGQLLPLKSDYEQLVQQHGHVKQERDRFRSDAESLQRQAETAQTDLAAAQNVLEQTTTRLAALTLQHEQTSAALTRSQQEARELAAKAGQDQAERATGRQALEGRIVRLQDDYRQLQQEHESLRREREDTHIKGTEFERRFQSVQLEFVNARKTLTAMQARADTLHQEKEQMTAALADARMQVRDLEARVATEQAKSSTLVKQVESLSSAAFKTRDEISRMEKHIGRLESEKARADELTQHLSHRDQEIGALQHAVSDRQAMSARIAELAGQVDEAHRRITELTADLAATTERTILAEEERDRYSTHVMQQRASLLRTEEDLRRLHHEQDTLRALLQQHQDAALKADEVEQTKLAREREAKEAESRRLDKGLADLNQALQDENAKGSSRVQLEGDILTITLLDRVLFEAGYGRVKPDGQKVLKRLSEVFKGMADKQIRVEGHTDDIPIGAKLKTRFGSNWELAVAKASLIVRYFLEQAAIDGHAITLGGYAHFKPIAGNDTEAGRTLNRRIEIVLFPKDMTIVASQTQP